MGLEYNLTVEQVARVAKCHRNTVLRYEKLKQILEIRRPVND
jgi:hypothetical protein